MNVDSHGRASPLPQDFCSLSGLAQPPESPCRGRRPNDRYRPMDPALRCCVSSGSPRAAPRSSGLQPTCAPSSRSSGGSLRSRPMTRLRSSKTATQSSPSAEPTTSAVRTSSRLISPDNSSAPEKKTRRCGSWAARCTGIPVPGPMPELREPVVLRHGPRRVLRRGRCCPWLGLGAGKLESTAWPRDHTGRGLSG